MTGTLTIPAAELSWTSARSGGPGGQHVNTTNTKVHLYFDFEHSPSLPRPVRNRLRQIVGDRLNAEGLLVITRDSSRSQLSNLEAARSALARLIRQALVVPKVRRPTKPSRAAKQRRMDSKRHTAQKKQSRSKQFSTD